MIAISSIAGMIGSPTMAPYIASKHAVYGLVQTAALELTESNVRVNAIGPGPIDNRMIRSPDSQFNPEDQAAAHEFVLASMPMKRYNALGRRIKTSNFLKGVTKYTYDGLDVIQDKDSNAGITKYQNGLGIDNKFKLSNGTIRVISLPTISEAPTA